MLGSTDRALHGSLGDRERPGRSTSSSPTGGTSPSLSSSTTRSTRATRVRRRSSPARPASTSAASKPPRSSRRSISSHAAPLPAGGSTDCRGLVAVALRPRSTGRRAPRPSTRRARSVCSRAGIAVAGRRVLTTSSSITCAQCHAPASRVDIVGPAGGLEDRLCTPPDRSQLRAETGRSPGESLVRAMGGPPVVQFTGSRHGLRPGINLDRHRVMRVLDTFGYLLGTLGHRAHLRRPPAGGAGGSFHGTATVVADPLADASSGPARPTYRARRSAASRTTPVPLPGQPARFVEGPGAARSPLIFLDGRHLVDIDLAGGFSEQGRPSSAAPDRYELSTVVHSPKELVEEALAAGPRSRDTDYDGGHLAPPSRCLKPAANGEKRGEHEEQEVATS